jgi:hypothetical protein
MKVKLLLIAVGLFFSATQINAQSVVRFSPLSLIKGKAKVHYEYGTGKIGVGVIAAGYYGLYPGFRVQPYGRFYITDEALKGFYVQPKFHFSMNKYDQLNRDEDGLLLEGTSEKDFSEYGFSMAIGWQFLLGDNENIVIDVFTGYRGSNLHNKDFSSLETQEETSNAANEYLYSLLHSNKFDMGLSIGFKF